MSDPSPTPSAAELQAAWRDGGQALRDGRHADALARFQQIIDAGQANTAVWIGVAMARRATDRAAERAALAEALKLEPRDLRALLMTADSYVASGDKRAADAYYDAFLKLTKATGDAAMRAEAPRAQRMRDEFSAGYSEHMNLAIAAHPLDRPEGRRMRRALDLMLGKTELFVQQPRYFYFPELPNIQYAEREQFPWLARVEAATDDIRAELLKVLEEDSAVSSAPSSAASPASAPAVSSGGGGYQVQPGDTLSAIAARLGVSVDSLAAANGLDPSGLLISGTTLHAAGAASPASASAVSSGGAGYQVQPGDTLSAIAARLG
ncbi:MAG: LysM peptidoglycan-binding domain-containing protein, partial [Phenylobacterium sp.]